MGSSGVGVSDCQVIGVKELENFEFVHELICFHLVAIKDLGFTSLKVVFFTSKWDIYVQGCIWKGVQVQGRSRW